MAKDVDLMYSVELHRWCKASNWNKYLECAQQWLQYTQHHQVQRDLITAMTRCRFHCCRLYKDCVDALVESRAELVTREALSLGALAAKHLFLKEKRWEWQDAEIQFRMQILLAVDTDPSTYYMGLVHLADAHQFYGNIQIAQGWLQCAKQYLEYAQSLGIIQELGLESIMAYARVFCYIKSKIGDFASGLEMALWALGKTDCPILHYNAASNNLMLGHTAQAIFWVETLLQKPLETNLYKETLRIYVEALLSSHEKSHNPIQTRKLLHKAWDQFKKLNNELGTNYYGYQQDPRDESIRLRLYRAAHILKSTKEAKNLDHNDGVAELVSPPSSLLKPIPPGVLSS